MSMHAPVRERKLCSLAELDDPGSREFVFVAPDGKEAEGLVIRKGALVRAYVNACPHVGVTLNIGGARVWDFSNTRLHCAMHGAMFRPEDGLCVRGPCEGDRLKPLPIAVVNGEVWLVRPDNEEAKR